MRNSEWVSKGTRVFKYMEKISDDGLQEYINWLLRGQEENRRMEVEVLSHNIFPSPYDKKYIKEYALIKREVFQRVDVHSEGLSEHEK